jgi:hypothetical protein
MILFIIIIYWNAKKKINVILGKDTDFKEELRELETNNESQFMETNLDLKRRSYAEQQAINTDRAYLNNSLSEINPPKNLQLFSKLDLKKLKKDDLTMKIDAVRKYPMISKKVYKMYGVKPKEDSRYALRQQIKGINEQLEGFHRRETRPRTRYKKQNKKDQGLNTSRQSILASRKNNFEFESFNIDDEESSFRINKNNPREASFFNHDFE